MSFLKKQDVCAEEPVVAEENVSIDASVAPAPAKESLEAVVAAAPAVPAAPKGFDDLYVQCKLTAGEWVKLEEDVVHQHAIDLNKEIPDGLYAGDRYGFMGDNVTKHIGAIITRENIDYKQSEFTAYGLTAKERELIDRPDLLVFSVIGRKKIKRLDINASTYAECALVLVNTNDLAVPLTGEISIESAVLDLFGRYTKIDFVNICDLERVEDDNREKVKQAEQLKALNAERDYFSDCVLTIAENYPTIKLAMSLPSYEAAQFDALRTSGLSTEAQEFVLSGVEMIMSVAMQYISGSAAKNVLVESLTTVLNSNLIAEYNHTAAQVRDTSQTITQTITEYNRTVAQVKELTDVLTEGNAMLTQFAENGKVQDIRTGLFTTAKVFTLSPKAGEDLEKYTAKVAAVVANNIE